MGRTTHLRQALRHTFYPFAIDCGFQVDEITAPLGVDFRRFSQDRIDVFDLQWEKHGRPRFVVNFGQTPSVGVIHFGEYVPPEKVLSYMGARSGRLQPRRGADTSSWFRQDRSFFKRLVLRQPLRPAEEVVEELLSLFQELERWFEQGRLGLHMRLLPYPWQQNKKNAAHPGC
jgi:hypothetical protein